MAIKSIIKSNMIPGKKRYDVNQPDIWIIKTDSNPQQDGVNAPPGSILIYEDDAGVITRFTKSSDSDSTSWSVEGSGIEKAETIVLVSHSHPNAINDSDLSTPFSSIQSAINALGTPVNSTDQKKRYSLLIESGEYDEDLIIPSGRRITFFCLGAITLGDGAVDANYVSTTARDITIDCTPSFGGRTTLTINVGGHSIFGTRCTQAAGFDISGDLILTGSPTEEVAAALRLDSVRIRGAIDGTALTALAVDLHFTNCRTDGNVSGQYLIAQNIRDSGFHGNVSIYSFIHITASRFNGDITVINTPGLNTNLPKGFYLCEFENTIFTGPAESAVFDSVSNYWFKTNGSSLGGSATKIIIGDLTP